MVARDLEIIQKTHLQVRMRKKMAVQLVAGVAQLLAYCPRKKSSMTHLLLTQHIRMRKLELIEDECCKLVDTGRDVIQ